MMQEDPDRYNNPFKMKCRSRRYSGDEVSHLQKGMFFVLLSDLNMEEGEAVVHALTSWWPYWDIDNMPMVRIDGKDFCGKTISTQLHLIKFVSSLEIKNNKIEL